MGTVPNLIDISLKNTKSVLADLSTISQMPANLTMATKMSLIAATREAEQKRQALSDGMSNISETLKREQEQLGIKSDLSNFRPAVLTGNQIQTRGTQIEGSDERAKTSSNAKSEVLAGVDPMTAALASQLKAILALGATKARLLMQTQQIQDQIDSFVNRLNSMYGTDAAAGRIREIEQNIEALENMYISTKKTLDNINKAYKARWEAYQKARTARDKALALTGKKIDDILAKVASIPEIPRFVLFPKFPKLPSVNITKANIKLQLSNFVNTIKASARNASKNSLEQSKKETQPKLETENPTDALLKASSTAKKTLQSARARVQALQAAKDAAIDTAAKQIERQIDRLNRGIVEQQKNIEASIDKQALKMDKSVRDINAQRRRAAQQVESVVETVAQTSARITTLEEQTQASIDAAERTLLANK